MAACTCCPAFWQIESRRWIDWKEITPIPDGAHDLKQIWNANCFNCHATNLVQGYDIASKQYRTTWTEMGIGCEACHGPGREHVALADAWEKDPAIKPAYDSQQERPSAHAMLKTLSPRSAEPRRVFDTCAYCHGNKTNFFVGFRAGDRYEDYALPFLLSDEIPANDLQGEFWPDGKPNRFNRNQALMLSGCFQAGAIACTNCHVAHGSRYEHSLKVNIYEGRYGDTLCTQCHQESRRESGGGSRESGLAVADREAAAAFLGTARQGAGPNRLVYDRRGPSCAHVPCAGERGQPVRQLPHERRQLAHAGAAARSHVPRAQSGDDGPVRRTECVHGVS